MADISSVILKLQEALNEAEAVTAFPAPTTADEDWIARSTAQGVIRAIKFDDVTALGKNQETSNYIESGWGPGHGTNASNPVIDPDVKPSGKGSLRFDLKSQTQSDGAGYWFCNFSKDLSKRFGENSEFFVQMRIRMNKAFHDTIFQDAQGSTQGGIKFFDVGAGDRVGYNGDPDASHRYDDNNQSYTEYHTNTDLEQVVNTYYQTRIVQQYAYSSTGMFAPFNERIAGGDYKLQNAMPSPFCLYTKAQTTGDVPGCFNFLPDQWITLQLGIKLGPKDSTGTHYTASRIRLWGAYEGQQSVLINDWKATHDDGTPVGDYYPPFAGNPIYDLMYGKLNLFPYLTNKSATQVHPLCQMWYDEVIISDSIRIADPGFTSAPVTDPVDPPVDSAPSTTFTNLTAGGLLDLGPFTPPTMSGEDFFYSQQMSAYSGSFYDEENNRFGLFGGGHAASNNNTIPWYLIDTNTWTSEYPAMALSAMTYDNYDFTKGMWKSTGIPAARHTEGMTIKTPTEIIVMAGVEGNRSGLPGDWSAAPGASQGSDHYTNTPAKIAHYNLASKTWSYSTVNGLHNWPAACRDPISGKILVCGLDGLQLYDPTARTMQTIFDFSRVSVAKNEDGTLVNDGWQGINQSMVYFPDDDSFYYLGNIGQVFRIKLDRTSWTATITKLSTSGVPVSGSSPEVNGVVYDSKNKVFGIGPWNGVFYTFNPVTKAWVSKTLPVNVSCAYHCLSYITKENAFMFITTGGQLMATRWN